MFSEVFDTYNLRARLSVYVIVISPLLLTLYTLYEPIRTIGSSVILLIIVAAFSNYFLALQRHCKRKNLFTDTTAKFLYLDDTHLNKSTKQRYYKTLASLDESFQAFLTPEDSTTFKNTCTDAVSFLINNTRDHKIVQEEGIMYGFFNNLISCRIPGLILLAAAVLTQILSFAFSGLDYMQYFHDRQLVLLLLADIAFILFWTVGISKGICRTLAEKYAYALLGSLDSIKSS